MDAQISKTMIKDMVEYFAFRYHNLAPGQINSPEFLVAMNSAYPTHHVTLNNLAWLGLDKYSETLFNAMTRFLELNPLTPNGHFIQIFRHTYRKRPDLIAKLEEFLKEKSKKFDDIDLVKMTEQRKIDPGWIESDLDKIVEASRKVGAKVVIQTYPPLRYEDFRKIDHILRQWWKKRKDKEGIRFQDVAEEFQEIFSHDKDPMSYYSIESGPEDQHLNGKGYGNLASMMMSVVRDLEQSPVKIE